MESDKSCLVDMHFLGLGEGAKHLTSMWGHPDQNEGPLAFADKRTPNWAPLEAGS